MAWTLFHESVYIRGVGAIIATIPRKSFQWKWEKMLFWRNWKVHQSMTYKKLLNIYLNSIPWHHFTMHHLFFPNIWCENWCFVTLPKKFWSQHNKKKFTSSFFFLLNLSTIFQMNEQQIIFKYKWKRFLFHKKIEI